MVLRNPIFVAQTRLKFSLTRPTTACFAAFHAIHVVSTLAVPPCLLSRLRLRFHPSWCRCGLVGVTFLHFMHGWLVPSTAFYSAFETARDCPTFFLFFSFFFFSSSSRCVAPNCCYRCDPVVPRLPACIFYNRLLFQTARVSDHREQSVSMRPPLDDFVQPHDRAWDKVQTFYSCASAAIQHLTVLGNHS